MNPLSTYVPPAEQTLLSPEEFAQLLAGGEKSARLIDMLIEFSEQIPEADLIGIPTDMSVNMDHYLYGLPKREE
jgi:hypothetical protein